MFRYFDASMLRCFDVSMLRFKESILIRIYCFASNYIIREEAGEEYREDSAGEGAEGVFGQAGDEEDGDECRHGSEAQIVATAKSINESSSNK